MNKLSEQDYLNLNIAETIPFGMDIVDVSGKILYANSKMKRLFGKDIEGELCWKVYRTNKEQCSHCPLKGTFEIGETSVCESTGILDDRIFEISHTAILYHQQKAILEIFQDITQRKRDEVETNVIKNRLQSVFDNMQEAYFQTDTNGIFTFANPAVFKLYGYKEEDLLGQHASVLYADSTVRDEIVPALQKEGKLTDFITRGVGKDGSTFWISVNAQYMYDESGDYLGIEGVVRDISSRIQYERDLIAAKQKAEENDRLKKAFLVNISHEIRTPMNGILGFVSYMSDPGFCKGEKSEFIKIINNCGERLMNTINDIIEMSKIEIGDIQLNQEEVDVSDLMRALYNSFSPQASEKGLGFEMINQTEQLISCDGEKIKIILKNLIKNAIKFTDSGKVEIGDYFGNKSICFYVSDTGMGIPKEKHDTIFDRFVQAENGLNRDYEGTGIGLTIVKSYVEALKGTVEVESEVGKGSTFVVTIPIINPSI